MVIINKAKEPLFIKNVPIKPNTRATLNEDMNNDITLFMSDHRDRVQIISDKENIRVICSGYLIAEEIDDDEISTIAIRYQRKRFK